MNRPSQSFYSPGGHNADRHDASISALWIRVTYRHLAKLLREDLLTPRHCRGCCFCPSRIGEEINAESWYSGFPALSRELCLFQTGRVEKVILRASNVQQSA
jgi:hypothetical protein